MTKNLIGSLVVALVVSLGVVFFVAPTSDTPVTPPPSEEDAGSTRNIVDNFVNGAQLGSDIELWKSATLTSGDNQDSVQNTTGRVQFYTAAEVAMIADSAGTETASSSYLFYVSTSSVATITDDFAAPSNTFFLIEGGLFATSSSKSVLSATTTSAGDGVLRVEDREFLVVLMIEEFGCIANGACETATSSTRGFDVDWRLKYHYQR